MMQYHSMSWWQSYYTTDVTWCNMKTNEILSNPVELKFNAYLYLWESRMQAAHEFSRLDVFRNQRLEGM